MKSTDLHVAIKIVDQAGGAIDKLSEVNKVAQGVSAMQAFREFDWLKWAPVTNYAGDLRGMVISGEWRTAYQFTVTSGKVLDVASTAAAVAALGIGIVESYSDMESIVKSNGPWNIKGAKLSTQVAGIAMKYLTGIVTAPMHAVLMSMPVQSTCPMIDESMKQPTGTCQQTLKFVDLSFQSAAQQVSNGSNIYTFVNTTLEPAIAKGLRRLSFTQSR